MFNDAHPLPPGMLALVRPRALTGIHYSTAVIVSAFSLPTQPPSSLTIASPVNVTTSS
jgi:hypothetical protein